MVVVDFSLCESSRDDKNPSDEQECDVFESCTGFSKYFSEQLQPIQLDAGID